MLIQVTTIVKKLCRFAEAYSFSAYQIKPPKSLVIVNSKKLWFDEVRSVVVRSFGPNRLAVVNVNPAQVLGSVNAVFAKRIKENPSGKHGKWFLCDQCDAHICNLKFIRK